MGRMEWAGTSSIVRGNVGVEYGPLVNTKMDVGQEDGIVGDGEITKPRQLSDKRAMAVDKII